MIKDQINLDWKTFKIDLPSLESYLRNKYPKYAGNSAHSQIELIFTEPLTDIERQDINTFYNNLKEADELVKLNLGSRKSQKIKQDKLNAIKLGMISKANSKYTTIEKKIELGLTLTDADWDTLL